MEEKIFQKVPMPLSEFMSKLKELAKQGKWKLFQEAVKKRKQYFIDNPDKGNF